MLPPVDRWGVVAELCPLVGGHRNLAFKTLGLPRELVFKTTRRTTASIIWLMHVHHIARQQGFVVPELIKSRDGKVIEEGWTCETYIEGDSFTPEEMPAILPLLSGFHIATADLPQRPGFKSALALLDEVSGGDVDLDTMPDQLASRCREAWRAVIGQRETIVHGDLNPGNLIRCIDGRTALIDWDECRRDLVLFDLVPLQARDEIERKARLAWEVACSWLVEPDHAKKVAMQL